MHWIKLNVVPIVNDLLPPQIGERDATVKTMIVVRKRIRARRATEIATTMTNALALWFVETTTVLDMDLMAVMIAAQVILN